MDNPLFGTYHLIMLAISIVLIVTLTLYSRKLSLTTVCKILFIGGFARKS